MRSTKSGAPCTGTSQNSIEGVSWEPGFPSANSHSPIGHATPVICWRVTGTRTTSAQEATFLFGNTECVAEIKAQ
jgi:hypothetical protein